MPDSYVAMEVVDTALKRLAERITDLEPEVGEESPDAALIRMVHLLALMQTMKELRAFALEVREGAKVMI